MWYLLNSNKEIWFFSFFIWHLPSPPICLSSCTLLPFQKFPFNERADYFRSRGYVLSCHLSVSPKAWHSLLRMSYKTLAELDMHLKPIWRLQKVFLWCHQLLPAFHYVFVALHFHNSHRHNQISFKLKCICLNRYLLSHFTCDRLNEIIKTMCICTTISFKKLPMYVRKNLGSGLLRCQNIRTVYDLQHY